FCTLRGKKCSVSKAACKFDGYQPTQRHQQTSEGVGIHKPFLAGTIFLEKKGMSHGIAKILFEIAFNILPRGMINNCIGRGYELVTALMYTPSQVYISTGLKLRVKPP